MSRTNQRKPPEASNDRVVWRITAAAPLGEYVTPKSRERERAMPAEGTPGGWVVSSLDLQSGAEVTEGPDTVPDDLFDELFAPVASPPPKSE